MFDPVTTVEFAGRVFCLTGEFVYAPRASCESATEELGGSVVSGVSKKLNYLVVGGFGSPEWKHGSFGTKIEKAIALKRDGVPISIVHENHWVSALTERRG
jgi:NAD-dependent DNA ligase